MSGDAVTLEPAPGGGNAARTAEDVRASAATARQEGVAPGRRNALVCPESSGYQLGLANGPPSSRQARMFGRMCETTRGWGTQ